MDYKVVKPRPRVRFSVKRIPVRLASLLYPYEGKAPDLAMERLTLSENLEKKDVIGLRIEQTAKRNSSSLRRRGASSLMRAPVSTVRGPVAFVQVSTTVPSVQAEEEKR